MAWVLQVRSTVVHNLLNRYGIAQVMISYEGWRTAGKGVERQQAKVEPKRTCAQKKDCKVLCLVDGSLGAGVALGTDGADLKKAVILPEESCLAREVEDKVELIGEIPCTGDSTVRIERCFSRSSWCSIIQCSE